MRKLQFLAVGIAVALTSCAHAGYSRLVPTSLRTAATSNARLGLISNGGAMKSFSDAVGMRLVSDADYELFIDPPIAGEDRKIAVRMMRLMPPNKRGDFIYIGPTGHIISNRSSWRDSLKVKRQTEVRNEMRLEAATRNIHTMSYPPSGGSGGPYIRNYSKQGVTAAYGYATIPCQAILDSNDHGFMYFNSYSAGSSGSVVDGGLEVYPNTSGPVVAHPFLNVAGRGYQYQGWTNEQQAYPCGTDSSGHAQQAVGLMFGPLYGTNIVVLAMGYPDYSPYQYQLPPQLAKWHNAAWIFYPSAPPELFANPGPSNGLTSPCTGCSVARMYTIAQTFPNSPSNACFGACGGLITGRWDQVVMGDLIQPCSQVQNQSEQCTIEYYSDGSWYGGENDSNAGINYSESGVNAGFEGINLQYVRKGDVTQTPDTFGSLAPYPGSTTATPTPSCVLDNYGYCAVASGTFTSQRCATSPSDGSQSMIVNELTGTRTWAVYGVQGYLASYSDTLQDDGSGMCVTMETWDPGDPQVIYGDPNLP